MSEEDKAVEWNKARNNGCLVLLECLSIENIDKNSEIYNRKTVEGSMIKLTSHNKELSVMFYGKLINKKANSGFLPQSTAKTFDYLRYCSNLATSDMLQGDMSEYMKYRGWTNKKNAYRQVRKDLLFLSNIRMEYNSKDENSFRMLSLFGGDCGIRNGKFFFRLSKLFSDIYKKTITQQTSPRLLKIDTHKYPPAYLLGKKLSEVYSMNSTKANAGKVSIESLINGNPYIPKYDPKNGKVSRNIIAPTLRSIEALSDVFNFPNFNELVNQNNIFRFLSFQLEYKPTNYPISETERAAK